MAVVGGRRSPTIRIYIDTPDGVGFDELSRAQAWIGEIVEAIDPFPGAYHLEVSSPGIDRPLRTREHFERFVGERCSMKLREAIDDRKSITGTLVAVEGDDVVIDDGTTSHAVPFDAIKNAHLIGTVDFSS